MEYVKYVCPRCFYEQKEPGVCLACKVLLIASCPVCGNPLTFWASVTFKAKPVEMGSDLIAETRDLALRYFGDNSDVSLAQVVEMAFKMRSLWAHSIKQGQQETGEAVSTWEFPESTLGQEDSDSIQNWLFRR